MSPYVSECVCVSVYMSPYVSECVYASMVDQMKTTLDKSAIFNNKKSSKDVFGDVVAHHFNQLFEGHIFE